MSGHVGHGLSSGRMSGGRAMISSWRTERRPLAVGGAQAVGAGVPAPDDDHVLALGGDGRSVEGALAHQVGGLQVVHGEVDAAQVRARGRAGRGAAWPRRPAPRRRTRPRATRPTPPHVGGARRAEPPARARLEPIRRDVASPGVGPRPPPWRSGTPRPRPELGQAPVEHRLLHLELGDAVAKQPAGPLGPLEDHHAVPGPGQLLGTGQPGRARAHHRHRLPGAHLGDLRRRPTPRPSPARRSRTRCARW